MNKGFQNEIDFVKMFDNKDISQIPPFLQNKIMEIFNCNVNEKFSCKRYGKYYKSDVYLSYKDKSINISIKSGNNVSVHEEMLEQFINFLESIGISNRTIRIIRFYHYGKKQTDDQSVESLPLATIKLKYSNYIKQANLELNHKNNYFKIIDRILFFGKYEKEYAADYIYYGKKNYGFLISKEQLMSYFPCQKSMYLNSIHVGPFIYFTASRTNYRINHCQFKWSSMVSDIINIIDEK